jgi:hypothetical protein
MPFRQSIWFGFVLGALFGTVGLWILAMLSLVLQPVELLAGPLFSFGRWLAGFLAPDGSMGNGGLRC